MWQTADRTHFIWASSRGVHGGSTVPAPLPGQAQGVSPSKGGSKGVGAYKGAAPCAAEPGWLAGLGAARSAAAQLHDWRRAVGLAGGTEQPGRGGSCVCAAAGSTRCFETSKDGRGSSYVGLAGSPLLSRGGTLGVRGWLAQQSLSSLSNHSFIQHTDRPPLARGRPTLAWAARAALPPGRMFGVGGVCPAIGGP